MSRRRTSSSSMSMFSLMSTFVMNKLFNPSHSMFMALSVLLVELVLNACIVKYVKYTEIDWIAYMQEVKGVLDESKFDYADLKGDTGPLVYPAGFVYIFGLFYKITNNGTDIRSAQCLFLALYLINLALVFALLIRTRKLPPYMLVVMSLASYRVHSIFVLRLFNDPVAMILLYASLNCFVRDKFTLGSIFFSLAVSVKMNVLLYAPALLIVYLVCLGPIGAFLQLFICASIQLILGLPFLLHNPVNYIRGSFDLGRVFLFEWTVNWRFLPEEVFVDKRFHLFLLCLHIATLLYCTPLWLRLIRAYDKLRGVSTMNDLATQLLLWPLFMCNLIGICFARSLHYQFYVWYFHTLHYLLWIPQNVSFQVRLLVLGLIELCWNTYPSTIWSSALLHLCHAFMLVTLIVQLKKTCSAADKESVVQKLKNDVKKSH